MVSDPIPNMVVLVIGSLDSMSLWPYALEKTCFPSLTTVTAMPGFWFHRQDLKVVLRVLSRIPSLVVLSSTTFALLKKPSFNMPSVSSVIHTTYMHYLVHARVLKLINLDTVTKIIS